jgi:hypothetical protein
MAQHRPRGSRTPATEAVANDDLAQAMIDTSSLERWPQIYFIGNYSGRINFFAQQTRALNLVCALISKGRIEAGDRVGVVGGGLAGVTAAVALLQKDIETDLFEQNHTLFRYQRNTATRHVHPSVNFWPDMPFFPSTNFPFLNWHEGTPGEIISAVRKEIDERFKNLRFKTAARVTSADLDPAGIFLNVTHWSLDGEGVTREGPYKALITACGFGLEKRPPSLPPGVPHSYWHNDDVLPPANPIWTREHVLVSGNGDGGLIDIIRASLERFDNGREIIALAKTLDTAIMRQKVKHLMAIERQGGEAHWEQQSAFDAYKQLPTSPEFNARLKDNLSRDFQITLNCSVAGLFSTNSSVIHRIIVAHLIKLGRVGTVIGKLLSLDWSQQPVRLRVGTKNGEANENVTWDGTATRVIVRWGAEGALEWVGLTAAEVEQLKTRQRMNFANSLKQAWPLQFYDNAKNFPPMRSRDYLRLYKPQVHRFFADKGASAAIGSGKAQLHYAVLCDSDIAVAELPETFFGVPIVGKRQSGAQLSGSSVERVENGGSGFTLRPGITVRVGKEGASYSTLSCLVESEDFRLGAVATLHGRSEASPERSVYFEGPDKHLQVRGLLNRTAALHRAASGPGLPDFGVFRLPDRVQARFSPDGKHRWKRVATKEELYDFLGKEVLQVGATSGLVSGVMELCDIGRLQVQADGSVIEYEGLMGVRGRRGLKGFSSAGDSGSIVFSSSGVLLGIIVAFNPRDKLTFAVPLVDVLAALQCKALVD